MESLNYSKQLLEFFETDNESKDQALNGGSTINELLSLLDRSIKFILPERGEILASYNGAEGEINSFKKEWVDLMYIPYPIVSFEIPFTYHDHEQISQIDGVHLQVPAEKRVALCWNPKHDDPEIRKINETINQYSLTPNDYTIGDDNSPDGFCIVVFFFDEKTKSWCFTPAGAFLPYSLNMNSDLEGGLYGREINLFPFYIDILYRYYDFNFTPVKNQIWLDLNQEIWSVLQVCCVLNCDNINTRTIEPPAKQQKSRLRKGLKPLYSYKVLTIKASGSGYESMYTVETGQGGSKRTHFRRGHIRRLPDKAVWVRSTIVGANNIGSVDKEYHIKN